MNRRERRAAASGARRGGPGPGDGGVAAATAELEQQILDEGRKMGDVILAKGRSQRTLFDLVDGALVLAEAFRQRHRAGATGLACKAGCNHCCHVPVGTSAPMVLRIAAALRAGLSQAAFAEALGRVAALDDKTHGLPWSPSQRPPLPCAFLVDGHCSIYSLRPFVCRAWNSTDAENCRRALTQDTSPLRFDVMQRVTFAAAEKGVQAALRAHGIDPVDLEFTAAMRVAMEQPDACERWLAGEDVFAGCEAKRTMDRRYHLPIA